MQITKIAAAVALSTGLLMGCDFDTTYTEETSTTEPTVTSPLAGAYWELSASTDAASLATMSSTGTLTNVYTFDGTEQCYYEVDSSDTTAYAAPVCEDYTDDMESSITFTYYGDNDAGDTVTGSYSVDSGALAIAGEVDGNTMSLAGADKSDDETIASAVKVADETYGNVKDYAVQIVDTLGYDADAGFGDDATDDTGELRLKLSDSGTGVDVDTITSGRLTVDFTYQLGEETVEGTEYKDSDNAYISFYSTNDEDNKVSSTYMHGEAIFERDASDPENTGIVKYRDSSGAMQSTSNTFTLGESMAVEVTWDADTYSFSVDGVSIVEDEPVRHNTPVFVIALRIGDNNGVTNYQVVADNLAIYSSDSGEEALVFEDDFDSYVVGQNLSGNPYNNNTSEAVVISLSGDEEEATDPEESTEPSGNYVNITDDNTGDTGELRYDFDTETATGSMEVYVQQHASADQATTVGIYDSAKSTSSVIADVKLSSSGNVSLRDVESDSTLTTYTLGEWVKLNVTWDVSDSSNQTFTLSVDDTVVGTYTRGNSATTSAAGIAIKLGSNSAVSSYNVKVDNLSVHSDTLASTEIIVDDFEDWAVGTDLAPDTSISAGLGKYSKNGFQAVVAE